MSNVENPYVGTRTFSEDEAHLFFGREREARDLLALVLTEQVVLFYAQSGTGKSSLLNTRIIPNLEKGKGFEALLTGRVTGELPSNVAIDNVYIYSLMRNLVTQEVEPEKLAHLQLKDFLRHLVMDPNNPKKSYAYQENTATEVQPRKRKRRILIIDQFEELFSTHPEEWQCRGNFFEQLAQAMEDDPYLWVLLVMREDYIAYLDPYAHLMSGGLRVRYYMQRMEYDAALKAVSLPVKTLRPYADGVAEELVEDLCGKQKRERGENLEIVRGQYVEPIVLQAVCSTLWENLPPEGSQITFENKKVVGDVNQALGKYYENRVRTIAELPEVKAKGIKEAEIRKWFGTRLITKDGKRTIVVRERGGKSGGLDDDVIQIFRRLNDLVREEEHSGSSIYELAHDRLADPIRENNITWEKQYGFPFRQQAESWKESMGKEIHLLNSEALEEAERWEKENPNKLTDNENEFLEACRMKQQEIERELEHQRQAEEREREREKEEQEQKLRQQQLEAAEQLATASQQLAQQQTRSARRANFLSAVAVVLAMLALVALGFAIHGTQVAGAQKMNAEHAEAIAESLRKDASASRLAGLVIKPPETTWDLSVLLGIEAYNWKPDNLDAQSALLATYQGTNRISRFLGKIESPAQSITFSPDGKMIAVQGDESIQLWNLETMKSGGLLKDTNASTKLFFRPDSKEVALLTDNDIFLWDVTDYEKPSIINEDQPINYHPGKVTQLIPSSDGSEVVSIGEDGGFILWNIKTGEKIDLPTPNSKSLIFAPDEDVYVDIIDKKIQLWSTKTGKEIGSPIDGVRAVFSPDSRILAAVEGEGNISLWDAKTATPIGETFQTGDANLEVAEREIVFSPDGKYLITRNPENNLVERTVISGDNEEEEIIRSAPAEKFMFSPTGKFLATISSGYLSLWDSATGRSIWSSEYIGGNEDLPIFSADDKYAIYVSYYDGIVVFDLEKEKRVNTYVTYDEVPRAIAADDATFVTESGDSLTLRTLNSNTEKKGKEELTGIPIPGTFQGFSQDGNFLIALDQGAITLWDKSNPSKSPISTNLEAETVIFSPKGRIAAILSKNSPIRFWDVSQGPENTTSSSVSSDLVTASAFSKDGTTLIIDDTKGNIIFLDATTGDTIKELPTGHKGKITSLSFSPDSSILASSTENSVVLMDADSGKKLPRELKGAFAGIDTKNGVLALVNESGSITLRDIVSDSRIENFEGEKVVFSPDGKTLAVIDGEQFTLHEMGGTKKSSDSIDGEFYGFSPDGKKFLLQVKDYYDSVYYVVRSIYNPNSDLQSVYGENPRFSPDSKFLLYTPQGTSYSSLRNLDTNVDTPISESSVDSIFSEDSKILAVGSDEGAISFWDVATGRQLGDPVIGHSESITGLALSPDGKTLISVGKDGGILLWKMAAPDVLGETVFSAPEEVPSLAINPNKNLIAVYSHEGIVFRGLQENVDRGSSFNDHVLEITSVSFSPDGKTLAATGSDGRLIIYNVDRGTKIDGPLKASLQAFSPMESNATNATGEGSLLIKPEDGELTLVGTGSRTAYSHFRSEYDYATYSPDGNFIITPARISGEKIFDVKNDVEIKAQIQGENPTFSPNGQWLILNDGDDTVLWNTSTWTEPSTLPGTFDAFSPDSKRILYTTEQGFRLWDLENGKTVDGDPIDGDYPYFTEDGQILYTITATYEGDTSIYKTTLRDSSTGAILTKAKSIEGWLSAPGKDGKPFLFYDGRTGGYKLWDLKKEDWINKDLTINVDNYFSLSSDGSYLVTSYQGEYTLWDLTSGKPARNLPELDQESLVGFTPNSQYYITGTKPKSCGYESIKLWKTEADSQQQPVTVEGDRICVSFKNQFAIAVKDDGKIDVWDLDRAESKGTLPDIVVHENDSLAFNPAGDLVAIYGNKGITTVDLKNMGVGWSLQEKSGIVKSMKFSTDGKYLATLGTDGIIVWDVDSQKRLNPETIAPPLGNIAAISFSGEGDDSELIFLTDDGTLYKSTVTGTVEDLKNAIPKPRSVCASVISPDGKILAYQKGTRIFVHRIREGYDEAHPIETKNVCSGAMTFSPDAKEFAYSDAGKIYLLDTKNPQLPLEIDGSRIFKQLTSLSFVQYDNDHKILAAESDENLITLWNINTRLLIGNRFPGDIQGLDSNNTFFYRDPSNQLIGLDFSNLPTLLEKWRDALCSKVSRNFTPSEYQQYFPGSDYKTDYHNTCPIETAPAS